MAGLASDAGMAGAAGKATTAAAAAAAAATRQQEDAQEFLGFLLDSAHQELLRLRTLHAHSLSDFGEQSPALCPLMLSLTGASVGLCPRSPQSSQVSRLMVPMRGSLLQNDVARMQCVISVFAESRTKEFRKVI